MIAAGGTVFISIVVATLVINQLAKLGNGIHTSLNNQIIGWLRGQLPRFLVSLTISTSVYFGPGEQFSFLQSLSQGNSFSLIILVLFLPVQITGLQSDFIKEPLKVLCELLFRSTMSLLWVGLSIDSAKTRMR
jgi:hypothetical protein